jgi:lipopolysaccharide transport system ATP-binding protein
VSDAVILENVSKQYRIGHVTQASTLQESVMSWVASRVRRERVVYENIWALKNISVTIKAGEVVGIIGRNGAGKSTLLKILSRITSPTSGEMTVNGRVASLLEVGTGFHEELSGRENVMLNGSILGMPRSHILNQMEAIVEFSGVEKFIDTPIKRYSSGMRLRLGFAIAAHLSPDILIIDEVLAVGDAGFQKKCLGAMEGLRNSGRTVLFVSHNLAAVENLCSRGIWIDAGKIKMDGGAKEVIMAYMSSFADEQISGSDLSGTKNRLGSGEIRYTRLEFLSPDGTPCAIIRSGDGLTLRFHYHAEKVIRDPSFGFRLFTELGTLITETNHLLHGIHIPKVGPGDGYIELAIDSLNLVPGEYALSLWITGQPSKFVYDGDVRVSLVVEVSDVYNSGRMLDSRYGIVYFPQRWRVKGS